MTGLGNALLTEVDRVAWDSQHQQYMPVILTGDLNLQPFSETYNLLSNGRYWIAVPQSALFVYLTFPI